ncbi:hypothetical protein [Roseofilum capinflatum]|uniref:Uncharacterized protein n=1 Tax=Roseofilum capinflatum BLCC-M114 TaxID=3022440 RepID=A0ABT7B050_9CYAN|nr:hypothetical protein [Roseofilum capinflatum]MDJ1172531.1 hypothetical protein [Roseofilum capinflatum BLCC-M114]
MYSKDDLKTVNTIGDFKVRLKSALYSTVRSPSLARQTLSHG